MQNPRGPTKAAAPATLRRRLFWLLVCAALGLGIALLGKHFTSDPRWFLALPAVLAAGWLFFANPDECMASCRKDDDATHQ
jgi:hypothetical protein